MQQKMFICKVEVAIGDAIHDADAFCQPCHFSPPDEGVKMGFFHTSFLCLLSTPKSVRVSPTQR